MSNGTTENDNQMALFGLPDKPKPAPKKQKAKKAPQPKPATASKKPRTSAKKKVPTKKSAASPSRSRSGLVPEGDIRLTANIREDLHLRLKIAAAKQRTTIGEIIEELVEKYV